MIIFYVIVIALEKKQFCCDLQCNVYSLAEASVDLNVQATSQELWHKVWAGKLIILCFLAPFMSLVHCIIVCLVTANRLEMLQL